MSLEWTLTCNTVVPGSTQTLWSSTKTSIFSGALAGVDAVVRIVNLIGILPLLAAIAFANEARNILFSFKQK